MVYVDEPTRYPGTPLRFKVWCHLWSDNADLTELHRLAQEIGLRREWFQNKPGNPHYDCVPTKRFLAIQAGARSVRLLDWYRDRKDRGVVNWSNFEPERFK